MADCAMIYDWHTRTHWKEKETEYCSVLRVLLRDVFAGGAFFLNLKQSSQRFIRHPSGFFCAGMGMRDCVDWQVGSRHCWRILL